MTAKQAQKWANALRSGKYQQTTCVLQDSKGYCCLGVACEIFAPKYKRDALGYLIGGVPNVDDGAPLMLEKVVEDLSRKTKLDITEINDGDTWVDEVYLSKFTFDEIADVIELIYVHKAL
jgi:hypothetical protein